MTTLAVTVKPGSKRPGIAVAAGGIELRVAAPAREGRANEAARRALAGALDLSLRDVTLLRGATARRKVFGIDGLSADEVRRRLVRAAEPLQPEDGSASSNPR